MFQVVLAGALQRIAEVGLRAAPTVICGLVVAAIFRNLIGTSRTRSLFEGKYGWGLFKSWALGMLLPVCSLGVIPIIVELRRAKVQGGSIMAFALTAPLFNPLSVLFGLTLADPVVLFAFCMGSLAVVTGLGVLWDKVFFRSDNDEQAKDSVDAASAAEMATPGWRRIMGVLVTTARESVGTILIYLLITMAGVGLITALLPNGRLQAAAEHGDWIAPAFMAIVAIPVYTAPMTVMMQLSSMFQHGNSIGAAFSLLVLGAGLNVGLIVWMLRNHPWRPTLGALGSLIVLVLAIAYAFDRPLYDTRVESAGHTHAFDNYCNPFIETTPNVWAQLIQNLKDSAQVEELVSGAAWLSVMGIGLLLVLFDSKARLDAWLRKPVHRERTKWDIDLPPWALGAVSLLGLVIASVASCFIYYPPRQTVLAEMRMVHAEVFSAANAGDWDTALYWIPIYEDWAHKLRVGMYLRGEGVSRYQVAKVRVLLEELERLEHEVEDEELVESQKHVRRLNAALTRLKDAFRKAEDQPTIAVASGNVSS